MEQKQKILILSWEIYPVYCGGLGILVQHLVDELQIQGHQVDILVPNTHNRDVDKNIINLKPNIDNYLQQKLKIPKLNFKLKVFTTSNHSQSQNLSTLIYPNNTPDISKAYAYAVKDYLDLNHNYDQILAMDWPTIATFCLLYQGKNPINTPFAFYINATELDRNYGAKMSKTSLTIHKLEKRFYTKAPKIFTVSSISKKVLIQNLKVPKSKITIINNDIKIQDIITSPIIRETKKILFLGRLVYQKGLLYLLKAFQKLIILDSDAQLVIVGDGEEKTKILKYIKLHKLQSKVKLIPWLEGFDKQSIYQQSTLFMMPSVSEPFGLTALESIRNNLPILASNRCGFCDVITTTPTFDFRDTTNQANMMYEYLNNHNLRKNLLLQQQQELSTHNWSREVIKIFEN